MRRGMRKLIYNIKVLRETAGLSVEELAKELGTTPRAYQNNGNGTGRSDVVALQEVAAVL
jgi:transcriptional regulator with XRE-family HTH domain